MVHKIENLCHEKPIEIQNIFSEVCGELTVHRNGRMSINDDAKSERSKTSTDELKLKLVADFLENVRRATWEEISEAIGILTTPVFWEML